MVSPNGALDELQLLLCSISIGTFGYLNRTQGLVKSAGISHSSFGGWAPPFLVSLGFCVLWWSLLRGSKPLTELVNNIAGGFGAGTGGTCDLARAFTGF